MWSQSVQNVVDSMTSTSAQEIFASPGASYVTAEILKGPCSHTDLGLVRRVTTVLALYAESRREDSVWTTWFRKSILGKAVLEARWGNENEDARKSVSTRSGHEVRRTMGTEDASGKLVCDREFEMSTVRTAMKQFQLPPKADSRASKSDAESLEVGAENAKKDVVVEDKVKNVEDLVAVDDVDSYTACGWVDDPYGCCFGYSSGETILGCQLPYDYSTFPNGFVFPFDATSGATAVPWAEDGMPLSPVALGADTLATAAHPAPPGEYATSPGPRQPHFIEATKVAQAGKEVLSLERTLRSQGTDKAATSEVEDSERSPWHQPRRGTRCGRRPRRHEGVAGEHHALSHPTVRGPARVQPEDPEVTPEVNWDTDKEIGYPVWNTQAYDPIPIVFQAAAPCPPEFCCFWSGSSSPYQALCAHAPPPYDLSGVEADDAFGSPSTRRHCWG